MNLLKPSELPRFGIVTALPKEFAAVRVMLDRSAPDSPEADPNIYELGEIPVPGGKHSVVITLLTDMGNNSAASSCAHLLRSYPSIEHVLMVGIACGIPQPAELEKHVRLGDIVISDKTGVIQYDNLKVAPGNIEVRDTSPPPSALLIRHIRALEASRIAGKYPWEAFIGRSSSLEGASRPDEITDRLFTVDGNQIAHPRDPYRSAHPSMPKLHYGRIGSANILLRDPRYRDELARRHGVRAVEMEGSGIADATWAYGKDYLLVRGVSDYGDPWKNDVWQGYAAVVAAAYARALLETVPCGESPSSPFRKIVGKKTSDSLQHIRRLSSISVADADIVDLSGLPHSNGPLRLDDELYAERKLEKTVFEELGSLARSPARILIVGEAGYGKTSLLWHLHRTLPLPDWEPWFLKSSLLIRRQHEDGSGQPSLTREDIAEAIGANMSDRKPLILLDTVDILLHHDRDREFLLEFVEEINDLGCGIIATCRHQEAALLTPLRMKSLLLDKYDDDELLDAVERHVKRFYRNSLSDESSIHLQHIQEAVARGLPLREICASPLMLRMLFRLYAPDKIPPEIHAFRLYDAYWNLRVKDDARAGEPLGKSESREAVSCALALLLLSVGSPDVESAVVIKAISQIGLPVGQVSDLISRGIIRQSETGVINFFHQTFFEHSAARAIMRVFGDSALTTLVERISKSWSDLFLAPIYEQALLLGEDLVGPLREDASKQLTALLANRSLVAQNSGIYVYTHRRGVTRDATRLMQEMLAAAPYPLIEHFLRLAPNISGQRVREVSNALDIVWTRSRWVEQVRILALLERLAYREPTLVRQFIDQHEVVRFAIDSDPNAAAERELVRSLVVLARTDTEWSVTRLLTLFSGVWTRTSGQDAAVTVMQGLVQSARIATQSELVDQIGDQIPRWHGKKVRGFEVLASTFGEFWFDLWKRRNYTWSKARENIKQTADPLAFRAKLAGLVPLLLHSHSFEVLDLIHEIEDEREPERRWLWVSVVLKRLMCLGEAASREEAPKIAIQARTVVRGILGRLITDAQNDLAQRTGRMLWELQIPAEVLRELIPFADFNDTSYWLDKAQLGMLLADAVLAGHPQARNALAVAVTGGSEHRDLLESTRSRFAQHIQSDENAWTQYLKLTVLLEDTSGLTEALVKIADLRPQELIGTTDILQSLLARLLASKSGRTRRGAVALWQELIRLGLESVPSLSDLFNRFERESDEKTRAGLLRLLGMSAAETSNELDAFVKAIRRYTLSEIEDVRTNARLALLNAISKSPTDARKHGFDVMAIVLRPPVDSRIVGKCGYVLDQILTSGDVEAALEFGKQLLFSEGVGKLGRKSRHAILHRLRIPMRLLARSLSDEQVTQFVGYIPSVDNFVGGLILDAVCHENFRTALVNLDALLSNGRVCSEMKELIRREKYSRERTVGGEAWPELASKMPQLGREWTRGHA